MSDTKRTSKISSRITKSLIRTSYGEKVRPESLVFSDIRHGCRGNPSLGFLIRYRPPTVIEDDWDTFKDDLDKLFPNPFTQHYKDEPAFEILKCAVPLKGFEKRLDYTFYKKCDTWVFGGPSQPVPTKRSVLFDINSASSHIAKRTRRGRGNHIIINPKCKLIDKETIKRNLKIKVHTRKWIPKREAFVFYKGLPVIDCAGMVVPQGLVCPEMGLAQSFLNYGQRIRWRD